MSTVLKCHKSNHKTDVRWSRRRLPRLLDKLLRLNLRWMQNKYINTNHFQNKSSEIWLVCLDCHFSVIFHSLFILENSWRNTKQHKTKNLWRLQKSFIQLEYLKKSEYMIIFHLPINVNNDGYHGLSWQKIAYLYTYNTDKWFDLLSIEID